MSKSSGAGAGAVRKFHVRETDRRKDQAPVAYDRRKGGRRDVEKRPSGEWRASLEKFRGAVERILEGTERDLRAVVESFDPAETTQIPTRNPLLSEAVRRIAGAQEQILEFARAAQRAALLTPDARGAIADLSARVRKIEERLAAHMAERLGMDRPGAAPRARRFFERIERLLA